jgi:hypothetical protein
MYIGWVSAAMTGLGLPSFVFLIGDIINSFNPSNGPEEMLKKIKLIAWIEVVIGAGIWILSYIYFSFLLMSSELITKKIRIAYVEAVLR